MAEHIKPAKKGGFLSRLLRDESGNVLAITAASILPMIAVIGGATDMSRIYMTKSRLQAACDAGVLAGRRAMTSYSYGTAEKARADSMFRFNFKSTDFDSISTSFVHNANAQGAVIGTATTTLPTVLMKMFGKTSTTISVNCDADLQVPNIDVVFVLDVTGSMADCPDNSNCGGGTGSKIAALRTAVKNFYTTLMSSVPVGSTSQVRFGFVPYSQAVNASDLFKSSPDSTKGELPLSHLADTMTVQSRVANFNTPVNGTPTVTATTTDYETYRKAGNIIASTAAAPTSPTGTPMSYNDCTNNGFAANGSFSIDGGPDAGTNWAANPSGSVVYLQGGNWTSSAPSTFPYQRVTYSLASNHSGQTSNGTDPNTFRICTRKRVIETINGTSTSYKFTNWTYKPVTFNSSQYKAGTGLQYVYAINSNYTVPTQGSYDPVQLRALSNQSGLTSATETWDGCLEERSTVATTSFSPIPVGAKDLNYLDGGTTADTYWRTSMPDLAYLRSGSAEETSTSDYSQPGYACPAAKMRNLNTMTSAQVDSFVATLQPNGYTYLDVGMVWGLRMIASQGMFSYRNLTGPNGGQISRHIIFLTDGVPVSAGDTYSAYAVENMDKRITGSTGTSAATLHAARFQALCNAQRGAVSIWAIGFGTSISGNLTNCADPNRAYQANNTADLNSAFSRIANDIADLRLVR